ncbi:bacterial alpha-L-rhamnosidase-domain-containing protein [Plectosphaerella plurivora]|uniref:alpha-L-rhamnosidase n=1 Tax=Plectosphaerella plurivora TaxID=936078 RepID=A0A9P8VGF3_9PEZI|nr:bacterial alpha-L-rhamnosidase-domain-containing protein [Plectosphaerella plurivora]
MVVQIERVQVEHHQTPLGIGEATPRLSWRFRDDEGVAGWMQSSYQIEITRLESIERELYTVSSSQSLLVPWPSQPLKTGQGASVRVRASRTTLSADTPDASESDSNITKWSPPVTVEAGLLSRSDWSCSLISSPEKIDSTKPKQPVLFRREFRLDGENITKARLYITAHGVYEAHINGKRVGDHLLAPGWTSYKHRLSYQTFDVTSLVTPDTDNAIAVQAAEGWFSGRLGFLGGIRNIWGNAIGIAAMLVIETEDSRFVVNTDGSWRSGSGSIITSELYDGEFCDLSLEPRGWQSSSFDDTHWASVITRDLPPAALVAPDGPPVRATETLPAASVFATPSGKTVVDFAQNIVGWVRLRLSGPKGHTVKMLFTEELENGEVATRPLRICKATDTITLSGEDAIWEPKFTYHGFRYVQIDGMSTEPGQLNLSSITAVVIHTDMEQTGWFNCSHSLLNKLHDNIRWGMRGNFLSIPTDCPQRDERLGWTGDINVFAPTANFLYDTAGMLQGWLKDVAEEQLRDHGSCPPFFCPDVPVDDVRYPTAIWGDVTVGLPWSLYTSYGDEEILKRQLESMQTWIDEGIPRDASTGLWAEDSYQFGDWLDPLAPPDDPGNSVTDPLLVANAHLVQATTLMQKISAIIGLDKQAGCYRESASKLKDAFQKRYISADGRVVTDSQTALALAIHLDLFDTPEQVKVAAARLKHLIRRNSRFKIATGFAGTPILGHALSRVGESQLFYRMLYHRKAPSWLYQVTMGATTMWERWDSKLPDGSINPGEMTSFNHYALGAVADWMHRTIAGLVVLEPGWRKFRVAPVPGGDLTHAGAEFLSPYGRISVKWQIVGEEDGTWFTMSVRVPPNTSAEVVVPRGGDDEARDEVVVVLPGLHDFRGEYERPKWPPLPLYPQFYPHDDDEP